MTTSREAVGSPPPLPFGAPLRGGGNVEVDGVLPRVPLVVGRAAVATLLTRLAERRTASLSMGRWSASLRTDTTTGVMAAANTVPFCQKWDTTMAAIPDANAAMTSV